MLIVKTYQRSREKVMEMISFLLRRRAEVKALSNDNQLKEITKELHKLQIVVKHIDLKLADIKLKNQKCSA